MDSFLPLRYPFILPFSQLSLSLSHFYVKLGTQAATVLKHLQIVREPFSALIC